MSTCTHMQTKFFPLGRTSGTVTVKIENNLYLCQEEESQQQLQIPRKVETSLDRSKSI